MSAVPAGTPTPIVPIPEIVDGLATDLQTAHYRVDALDDLWGTDAAEALFRGSRVPASRALERHSGSDPLVVLARCFLLTQPVPADELAGALPTAGLDGARAAGLVAVEDGVARALVDLRPYSFLDDRGAGSWWIVSDLGETSMPGPLPEGHVLGIGGASTTLSGLQIPVHVGTVLDLGTGCGIQAMHARRFADQVVATDISERALAIAALNARLNQIDGIEFRLGSLFEPVAGERFDRIVSNPPFVITPRRDDVPSYEYRDGGMVGDDLVRTVLRGLEAHLTPGGTAQLLGNWESRDGVDALDRVADWFVGGSLDAWVVERERLDPARYAETWIRDGGTKPGTPQSDALVDAWLNDFAARGVESVGFGYVLARAPRAARPAGTGGSGPVRRFERLPESLGAHPAGLGATVARTFDAWDWLAEHNDDALARTHLRVAGDVTEERHYWPGNDDPTVMTLVQGGGFGRRVDADTALAAFVGACDGVLAAGSIIAAIAEITGADEVVLRADLLPAARDLIRDGLLLTP